MLAERLPVAALVLTFLLVPACLTTDLPPISDVGAGFKLKKDEARLWRKARVREKRTLDVVDPYDDPELAGECYRGWHKALTQMTKPNDTALVARTADVFRRLCRVDPLAALSA